MARKAYPSVVISLTTKAKQPIENVTISTVVRRSGSLRRRIVTRGKKATRYRVKMMPGKHPFVVSARYFLQEDDWILFEKGVEPEPVKDFKLRLKKEPRFYSFGQLSGKVQNIFERSAAEVGAETAEKYYENVSVVRKAAALNILAKMAHTPVIKGYKAIDYIDYIYKYSPDRFYAKLMNEKSLLEHIRLSRKKKKNPLFMPAASSLHKGFEAASFKTREEDLMGNLQLSFSSEGAKDVKIDADIDIYSLLSAETSMDFS